MPRDGSGIYTLPYPPVVDGTTIESAVHNGTMSDIALQLNGPVPIVAGGTGANNAHDARIALGAEVSGQQVTNYDSHVFEAGSFFSVPGATGAPEASLYYSGICHSVNTTAIVIEATAYSMGGLSTGKVYRREKWVTWGVWSEQAGGVADLDARFVNLTGDTMTGNLTTSGNLNAAGEVVANTNITTKGWGGVPAQGLMFWGDTGTKYIFMSGAAWGFYGAGVTVTDPTASTSPSTGALTVAGGVGIAGQLNVAGATNSYDITTARAADVGALFFGTANTKYIYQTGSLFQIVGTPVTIPDATASSAGVPTTGALTVAGGVGVGGSINVANAGRIQVGESFSTTDKVAVGGAAGAYSYGLFQAGFGHWSLGMSASSATLRLSFGGVPGVGTDFLTVNNAGTVNIPTATASTGTTAGALVVTGGVGINKELNVSGITKIFSTTPATAWNTGALQVTGGGLGVNGSGFFNGTMAIHGGAYTLPGSNVACKIAFAGGGTQYGMAFRPGTDSTVAILFSNSADGVAGSINTAVSTTTYNTSSDGRLKEDLKSFDAGNVVDNTDVYDFAWKTTGERSYGVIAQQAMDVYPAAVTYLKEQDWYGIDYSKYVPVLLQELKALRARVAMLEGGVEAKPAKKK